MSETNNISNGQKIAFIGCGNMANAIISGLIASGWPSKQIMASNPSNPKLDKLSSQFNIQTTNNNSEAADFGDIVVLAVKPQKLSQVCQQLAKVALNDRLIISVAAGYKADKMLNHLQQNTPVIRAMPNTPALIQCGATGLFATKTVSTEQKAIAESIFQAVGQTIWVSKESEIDIVTAIAGSSPAYIFLMMQSMIEEAVDQGMSEDNAFQLITQAVSGSAQLAQASPDKTLTTLRKEVTSPGGTTAAAITSLINDDFIDILKKAVKSSIQRAKELGNQ
ncbi:pyrroline-5-carboxylate reductase [Aliikangiella sp. IMCC44359]|uniref:pyrroline-5-carboxylate reductase n=1 Tax=Aliikangiella sp. IMCC44359 TaxID=3459125 RepID=UPI00403AF577